MVRNEKKLLEEHGHEVFTYYRSNKELNEGNKLKKSFNFLYGKFPDTGYPWKIVGNDCTY